MKSYEALKISLESQGIPFQENIPLSTITYMKTGGNLRILIKPACKDDFCRAVLECAKAGVPYRVVGAMSNILFLDNISYGALISTTRLNCISVDPAQITAECGALLEDVSRTALNNHMIGFEGLEGIPGTVGGAVVMNAGAYNSDMQRVAVRLEMFDPKNASIETVPASDLKFGYRTSLLRARQNWYVLKCYFSKKCGNEVEIYRRMELYHAKRHRYNEYCYPNLGSLFSGDLYGALARNSMSYRMFLRVYHRLAYRYKLLGRESPVNRNYLNQVTSKHFGLEHFSGTYSRKTMNCIVNRGQGTGPMLDYINALERLVRGRIPLENEIMKDCVTE